MFDAIAQMAQKSMTAQPVTAQAAPAATSPASPYYDQAKLQQLLAMTAPAADGRKVLDEQAWMQLLNPLSGVKLKNAAQDGYSSDNNGNSFQTHIDGEYQGADGQFFRQVGTADDGSPLIQYSNKNGHGWDNPTGNAGKDRVQPTYKLGADGTATPVSAGVNYQGSPWVDYGRSLAEMAAIMGTAAVGGSALAGAAGTTGGTAGATAGLGTGGGWGASTGGLGFDVGAGTGLGGFGGTGMTGTALLEGGTGLGAAGTAAGYGGAAYAGASSLGSGAAAGGLDLSGIEGAQNFYDPTATGGLNASNAGLTGETGGTMGGGLQLGTDVGAGGFGGTGLTSTQLLAGSGAAAGLAGAASSMGGELANYADYANAASQFTPGKYYDPYQNLQSTGKGPGLIDNLKNGNYGDALGNVGDYLTSSGGLSTIGGLVNGLIANNAASKASDQIAQSAREANALQKYMYDTTRGDQATYRATGDVGATGMRNLLANPGAITEDPSYKFGLDQGTQALQRNAGAKGGYYSGATLKALERYGQDYGTTKLNDAYGRYGDAARLGEAATANTAVAGQNYANQAGNNITGAGSAAAGASLYGGNSWQNAINNGLAQFNRSTYQPATPGP